MQIPDHITLQVCLFLHWRCILLYGNVLVNLQIDVVGFTFLATNLCYFIASSYLFGNSFSANIYGSIVDLAGLVSLYYHSSQLWYGPGRKEVVVALLVDYCVAFVAVSGTLVSLYGDFTSAGFNLNNEFIASIVFGLTSFVFLFTSWTQIRWVMLNSAMDDSLRFFNVIVINWLSLDSAVPYLLSHGMWHVFSALAGTVTTSLQNCLDFNANFTHTVYASCPSFLYFYSCSRKARWSWKVLAACIIIVKFILCWRSYGSAVPWCTLPS